MKQALRSASALCRQDEDADPGQRENGSKCGPRIRASGIRNPDEPGHGQHNAPHDESPPECATRDRNHARATKVKTSEGRC